MRKSQELLTTLVVRWRTQFVHLGFLNYLAVVIDRAIHARYRHLLDPSLSEAALREQELYVRNYCDLLISKLKEQ
jgi:hypothetical protein